MMDRSYGKGLFLVNLAILGAIAAVLLYQVPQPWRGYLVAWLVFLGSLGLVMLKVLKHVYAYKSLKLTADKSGGRSSRAGRKSAGAAKRASVFASPKSKGRSGPGELKIVEADDVGRGRHTIN